MLGGREQQGWADIAAIAERLDAAMEEWKANEIVACRLMGLDGLPVVAPAIMAFLTNAPTDVAALLAEVLTHQPS